MTTNPESAPQPGTIVDLGPGEHHPDAPTPVWDPFKYRKPDPEDQYRYENVAEAMASAYHVLLASVPRCAERTLAIRHLQYARMMANAAISFKGAAVET